MPNAVGIDLEHGVEDLSHQTAADRAEALAVAMDLRLFEDVEPQRCLGLQADGLQLGAGDAAGEFGLGQRLDFYSRLLQVEHHTLSGGESVGAPSLEIADGEVDGSGDRLQAA